MKTKNISSEEKKIKEKNEEIPTFHHSLDWKCNSNHIAVTFFATMSIASAYAMFSFSIPSLLCATIHCVCVRSVYIMDLAGPPFPLIRIYINVDSKREKKNEEKMKEK